MNKLTAFLLAVWSACAVVAWSFVVLSILAILSNANAAEGDSYATLQEAATAALSDAEALTDKFEAGGTLYSCLGKFTYKAPVTSGKRDSVSVMLYASDACKLAGLYHTHPRGDTRYSKEDISTACAVDTVSFIKPRGGNIRAFDCSGFSDAAKRVALERPITGKTI